MEFDRNRAVLSVSELYEFPHKQLRDCFPVINFFIIFLRNSFVDLIQQSAVKFIVLLYE